jgi:hypothetical protein
MSEAITGLVGIRDLWLRLQNMFLMKIWNVVRHKTAKILSITNLCRVTRRLDKNLAQILENVAKTVAMPKIATSKLSENVSNKYNKLNKP